MAQQELNWLKGELQRVEQDIKNREEEYKAATTERDIAIIQKGIDRLVQEKRDVRQQLSTLQAQLASPADHGRSELPPHPPDGPARQNLDSLAPHLTADDAAPESVFRLTGRVGDALAYNLFLDPKKAIQHRISGWADSCAVLFSMGQPAAFKPFFVNGLTKVSIQKSSLSKAA
ncbi:hypothetical protein COCSUDRAFT_52553 [Coccomyxa subellipsoidea C-169]|uniref:Uncharacterized protein n=1 Tax=Coccomyxa subellipsoidea (strain C-169) TaxID=574566 RepID=I0Z4Z8_COCSC|nr:hypothetical protein COCSUDRAFT_52553 [Coccomyxa subellipsoidea C-169]EIE25717.1 hypothetical protein COCSUDRAFT_52553 [Coccomyxa subellipsoidea C-169]|eukprot:XP_005650261.1 hypothetical protein COCSUDRAFT_52553 [Coccomyxa subellipsoidea C-169]